MKRLILVTISGAVLLFAAGCSNIAEMPEAQENIAVAISPQIVNGVTYLNGVVPHTYEYGLENPDHKNWCAHVALKMAARFVKPSFTPDLFTIHDMFWDNTATYRANGICADDKWCGRMLDQLYAAQRPIITQAYIAHYDAPQVEANHGFGLPNSVSRSGLTTVASWYAKVKDGINNNYPVITFSNWNCPYGHSYVITGYKDTGDVTTSVIAIRDSLQPSPLATLSDWLVNVTTFYNQTPHTDLLFIKP
jgi:hypothetical protein